MEDPNIVMSASQSQLAGSDQKGAAAGAIDTSFQGQTTKSKGVDIVWQVASLAALKAVIIDAAQVWAAAELASR